MKNKIFATLLALTLALSFPVFDGLAAGTVPHRLRQQVR